MSLKKRMFRYNMGILFLALISLMAVVVFVLVFFEDSFERQFHQMGQEILNQYQGVDVGILEKGLTDFLGKFLATLTTALFLIGIGAIAVILSLASFFTKRMNRMVMEPLDELVKGANRIKSGNLQEEIYYQGEREFEHVCQTFNDMQQTILADQEQRIRDEKARTDMVTGISHDLRTPLTSVQGYIKGVLDEVAETPEKKEKYLRTAYESTVEMNVLLQKLFDFSRMESGQMPFCMVKADLAEFTAAYVARKEKTFDKERLQFHLYREKEDMPEILMDVDQIRRIFDNLLENSQKYAQRESLHIEIRIFLEGRDVVLSWKDNGEGVPREKLDRIFDKFYRCDESRTEKGSGVGLYVVKYIMEYHQGQVKAENEKGLKITLRFPKAEDGL